MLRTSAIPSSLTAVAIAALLAGCGGADEAPTAAAPLASSGPHRLSAEDQRQDRSGGPVAIDPNDLIRVEADQRGILRRAYAVSPQIGDYGATLAVEGWETRTVNLREVPNTADTVLYVNASDPTLDRAALKTFVGGFAGVLVIDSQTRFPVAGERDHGDGSLAASEALEAGDVATSPASDLYMQLSDGKARWAPLATALLTSSTSGSVMPVIIDTHGGVNGARAGVGHNPVDLSLVALDNLRISQNPLHAQTQRKRPKGFNSSPNTWDRVVDLNYTADNWNVIGRAYVEAFKEGSGNRHFIAVEIDTGNNMVQCYVSGKECGIYPQSNSHEVRTEKPDSSTYKSISYAVQYSARASVYPATQVMEYRPSKTAWTATEAVDSDSYEKVWSEGFSVGGSAGVSTSGAWSLGASASYSKSTTHRKRMHKWDGDGGIASENWVDNGVTWKKHTAYSGVKIKDTYRYNFIGAKTFSSNHDDAAFEQAIRRSQLEAYYCYGTGKTWGTYVKPKMSWQGWNPMLGAMFEVPASRVQHSSRNSVNVNVGFRLGRQINEYTHVHDKYCYSSPGYVGFKGYSGYAMKGQNANDGDTMVKKTSWREYNRSYTLVIYPSSFTN